MFLLLAWTPGIRRRANPVVDGYRRAGANGCPCFAASAVFVVAFVCVSLLFFFCFSSLSFFFVLGLLLSVTRSGISRLILTLGSSRTAVLFNLIPRGIEEEDRAILEVIVSSVLWCVGVCVGGVCVCGGGCLCGCVCWSVCWFGGVCLLVLDNVAWPVQRTELVNE